MKEANWIDLRINETQFPEVMAAETAHLLAVRDSALITDTHSQKMSIDDANSWGVALLHGWVVT